MDGTPAPTVKKELADVKTVRKEYGREARAQGAGGDRPKRNDVPMYAQKGPTLAELYAKLEGLPESGPERDDRVSSVMRQIAQKFRNPDFLLANGLITPQQYADPNYLPDLFASAENPTIIPHSDDDIGE